MGKEISYCRSCGHRLLVNESEQNRVYVHDGRRFCERCCPAGAVPEVPAPTAPRRQTSTRLRQQPPAPRPRETTRIRKRSPLPLALSAAAVLALGIGIAVAAGGSPPPPAPPDRNKIATQICDAAPAAPPAPSIDETLARVREMRQSDLLFERRDDIVRLLRDLAGRSGPRLEEVDLVAAEYDRKFEEAAARLADFTRSEALRMASKQKFAEAIDRVDGFPATFRASKAAESLRLLRQDLERRRADAAVPVPAPSQAPRRVL